MAAVEITAWQQGFRKVSCSHVIRAATGLGLADAKRVVDAVLAGAVQRLEIPSDEVAYDFIGALRGIGALARLVPDHGEG